MNGVGKHYQASTRLRYQRLENHLEDEPHVRTPICQSLMPTALPIIKVVQLIAEYHHEVLVM